ncbi:unnamed protein product [Peniophora sp. CBMAI 1063]|nr:unnamed protein product [Peniophora sp. CBMAI 1063]
MLSHTTTAKQWQPLSGALKFTGSLASYRPRHIRHFVALFAFPACLWLLWRLSRNPGNYAYLRSASISKFQRGGDPPNYYKWHEQEKAMPQNDPDLPPPQGREGRYLRFKNHLANVGWGNSMQEMIANHHLAYQSKRIFVMYNFTWDKHTDSDYSQFEDHKIPARIPISALVAGPLAGGEYPMSQWRPPAVTTEFFDLICPHPTIVHVDNTKSAFNLSDATAVTIFNTFTAQLNAIEDNCVELQEDSGQILDFFIFGSGARMADLWRPLLSSPVLTGWEWSSLVTSIVTQNRALIHPAIALNDASQRGELKGLLALHLRRGDFKGHCENLSNWRWGYNAFNVHPNFPDQLEAPPGGGGGSHTDETLGWYNDHCYPEIPRIVERVKEFRADAEGQGRALNRIYVLTNGDREWISKLKVALDMAGKWESVTTSRDLDIDWDQEFVKQAADMFIATRAEVFAGNAWSSLSSNVNLLRVSQNHDPETSRFW